MSKKLGLIHVYTGSGQGKTSAAFGLALRALGAGLKVCLIQFMKTGQYSEIKALGKFKKASFCQFGRKSFVNLKKPAKIDIDLAQKGLEKVKEVFKSKKYDLVILDEINVAIKLKLLKLSELLKIIKEKPQRLELVLTGRYAHPKVIKLADYVTEMKEIKHPYKKGMMARRGIDF
jgi:cob(I)alamin adenosyltransferase